MAFGFEEAFEPTTLRALQVIVSATVLGIFLIAFHKIVTKLDLLKDE